MTKTAENNKRIAKNTGMLYVRMLLIMVVSLYTSRVVLNALGVEDFGIYNVVGGIVSMLGFFTSSLSNVTQRYINVGLGRNDKQETEYAFRQSFTLMFYLSVLLLVVGETAGLWFVLNKLVISPDRMFAVFCIYQFSLLSVVVSINQISFMGAIVAHECMDIYAYLGIFEACARLAIAYLLLVATSVDSLILYGFLTALVSLATFVFYAIYSRRNFEECKFRFYWNRSLVREMGRFVGYNLFGCFSWSVGIQGTNILLNLFFGPVVNASRAISVQVSTIVVRFTENIMTAVKPQVIQSYVAGNRAYMMALIEKSSKYAFYLTALFAIPIMVELHFILDLWLGQVPEHAVLFTRLVLCESLVGVFIPSLWIAANATGNIKRNQVYGRLFTLSVLPLSYVALRLGAASHIPFVIALLANAGYWLYCLQDIHLQLRLSRSGYLRRVMLPSAGFVLVLASVGLAVLEALPRETLGRVLLTFASTILAGLLFICCIADKGERDVARRLIRRICPRS